MRILHLLPTVFLLFLFSCSLTNKEVKSNLISVDVNTKVQFFSPQQKLEAIENTVRIVAMDNQRVYIVPRVKVEEQNIQNADGKIIGTKGVYTDTSYVAFAWNIGDKVGLEYYDLSKSHEGTGVEVKVDSILADLGLSDENFAPFNIDLPSPVSVSKHGALKYEKYSIPKIKANGIDSIYRFYDKRLKDVDFSFSNKLDKFNKSKLYKIVFIWNEIPAGVLSTVAIPKREGFYEIALGTDKNTDRLRKLFSIAKSDRKKMLGLD